MDKLFRAHVKAFLLSQQISDASRQEPGEDPADRQQQPGGLGREAARHGRPRGRSASASWPRPRASRPVVPWWWYAKDKEPVPDVVKDIYKGLAFDFALVYPKANAWVYVSVEPPAKIMELMLRQEHLKAFILMSLINKNFPRAQREGRRVRLGDADEIEGRAEDLHLRGVPGGRPRLPDDPPGASGVEPARAPLVEDLELEHQAAEREVCVRQFPRDHPRALSRGGRQRLFASALAVLAASTLALLSCRTVEPPPPPPRSGPGRRSYPGRSRRRRGITRMPATSLLDYAPPGSSERPRRDPPGRTPHRPPRLHRHPQTRTPCGTGSRSSRAGSGGCRLEGEDNIPNVRDPDEYWWNDLDIDLDEPVDREIRVVVTDKRIGAAYPFTVRKVITYR